MVSAGTTNVVDLFCGVGGLSLGAARAGFTIRGGIDTDHKALNTHFKNFPMTVHINADVASLTGRSICSQLGLKNIDGIIGGPPCQGFSSMGKGDLQDARNILFAEFFRLVSEIKPKFFLAENVPGIMRDIYQGIRDQALSFVQHEYNIMQPMELAAHEYGAPTTRRRVFFVGFRKGVVNMPESECFRPGPNTGMVRVKDALRGLPTNINPNCQTEESGWRVASIPKTVRDYAKRTTGACPRWCGGPRCP